MESASACRSSWAPVAWKQIMEINLTAEEKTALGHSAASVQELVDVMRKAKAEGT